MTIGEGCNLYNQISDFGSEPFLIRIGSNVTITHGVMFLTHDASTRLFRKQNPELNQKYRNKFGTIQVGDNSFIGVNTIILPNVKIGPNSIVGAGSIVTKDVAPNTVVAGNPARFVCSLEDYIQKATTNILELVSTERSSLEKELKKKLWKA
jgi:acetyltransferase-like isoleucine patch superfamily enzyme